MPLSSANRLISSSAGGAAIAQTGGMAAARLDAIKADVHEHLTCPELTVGAVAARQGITPRYVQRLFEREGTTFSAFVRGQRLVRACRMLGDPLCARWSITAIAFEAGFGDLSYFNRCFRRRYASSPSDLREAALRGQAPIGEPGSSFPDKSKLVPVQAFPSPPNDPAARASLRRPTTRT